MSKLYVAITGGIGSGKSLVLQYLRELHYPTFSCDELYKKIITTKEYVEKVDGSFPGVVQNGEINRKLLSELVFNDDAKRKQLNAIAHPMIMDLLMKRMQDADGKVVFAEVPLLFEGNHEKLFDKILYVKRDKAQRIASVEIRDGLQIEHIKKRMDAQFDSESAEGQKHLNYCKAYILENNSTPEELKRRILDFLNAT